MPKQPGQSNARTARKAPKSGKAPKASTAPTALKAPVATTATTGARGIGKRRGETVALPALTVIKRLCGMLVVHAAASDTSIQVIQGYLKNSGRKRRCTGRVDVLRLCVQEGRLDTEVLFCVPKGSSIALTDTANRAGASAGGILLFQRSGNNLHPCASSSCFKGTEMQMLRDCLQSMVPPGGKFLNEIITDNGDAMNALAEEEAEPAAEPAEPAAEPAEPAAEPAEPAAEPSTPVVPSLVKWEASELLKNLTVEVYWNQQLPFRNLGSKTEMENHVANTFDMKGGVASRYMVPKDNVECVLVLLFPPNVEHKPEHAIAMAFGEVNRCRRSTLTLIRVARLGSATEYKSRQPEGLRWGAFGLTKTHNSRGSVRWCNARGQAVNQPGQVYGSPNPIVCKALVELIKVADVKEVTQDSTLPCGQLYHSDQTYDHGAHPATELIYHSLGFKAVGDGASVKSTKNFVLYDVGAIDQEMEKVINNAKAAKMSVAAPAA